jgi:hypothetical protein
MASRSQPSGAREPISRAAPDAEPSAMFTPGPWEVSEPDANGQPVVRGPWFEVATCWHHCVGSICKEAEANARLIAKAPEMHAALTDILALHAVTELCKPEEREAAYDRLDDALMRAHAILASVEAA